MAGPAEGGDRTIDGILARYADDIHPSYTDAFSRLAATARDRDDPSDAALAALDKTAAYMAHEDRPYTDIADEYGVGPSSVHYHLDDIHDAADLDMSFNGHPRKIVDAAVEEAERFARRHQVGKTEAARRVAPRHGIDPEAIRQDIPGESHSRYATDGTTERLYQLVLERPRTTAELVEAVDPASPPGNYLRRRDDIEPIDHVYPEDNHRIVVWYQEGSEDAAGSLLAQERARYEAVPRENFPEFVTTAADRHREMGADIRDDWSWHWLWADARVREERRQRPQHFEPAAAHLEPVRDHLLDYDPRLEYGRRTHFDAADILETTGAGENHVGVVSRLLQTMEDVGGVLDGVGGRPRKFDSRTIDAPSLLMFEDIVRRTRDTN